MESKILFQTHQFPEASVVEGDEGADRGILLGGVVAYILVSNHGPVHTFNLGGGGGRGGGGSKMMIQSSIPLYTYMTCA